MKQKLNQRQFFEIPLNLRGFDTNKIENNITIEDPIQIKNIY